MVSDQVVSVPDGGTASHATATERRVCEAGGELVDVRSTGFGENVATQCVGRAVDSSGPFGYVQQSREEMEVLFTLIADRYERTSIMISSNLPFSKWERIFKDPMTTATAIDRLVHHSTIIEGVDHNSGTLIC